MSGITWLPLLFLVALTAASLVVWALAMARWEQGRPALPYRERNPVHLSAGVVIAAGAAWLLVRELFASVLGPAQGPSLVHVQASCAANLLTLLLVREVLLARHARELDDLGLRFREPAEEAAHGACGFLAGVLPVLVVVALTMSLRDPTTQHAFLRLLEKDATTATLMWIAVAVVGLAPLTEELLFRVILQGALQTRVSPPYAIVVTAIAFAAIHGLPDSLPLVPLALILGYVFYRRNSYLAVVILHALFNLSNLLLALFPG